MRDMEVIETDRLTDREGTYKERETDRDTERVTNKNKKYIDRGQDRDMSSKICDIKNKCDDINRKKMPRILRHRKKYGGFQNRK